MTNKTGSLYDLVLRKIGNSNPIIQITGILLQI